MKFEILKFKADLDGTWAKVIFDNGYGASVITGRSTFTDPEHPFELAVLHEGCIVYNTPITDDVLGYLTEEDVERILADIEAL